MNQYLQYIRYLLKAKNAHGLHSPFVFDLYQGAISVKNTSVLSLMALCKYEQLLFKVLNYKQIKKLIYIGSDFSDFSEKFSSFFHLSEQTSYSFSMSHPVFSPIDTALYLGLFDLQMEKILHLSKEYKMIIVSDLTKNRRLFDFFCHHPHFIVTIDCYGMGFIFQRPQSKEHFILKY